MCAACSARTAKRGHRRSSRPMRRRRVCAVSSPSLTARSSELSDKAGGMGSTSSASNSSCIGWLDSETGHWLDSEPSSVDLFNERSGRLLPTFPTSGMTRSGRLFPLPVSAHPTSVSEFSSSQLMPTPTTQPATGNGHARNLGKEVSMLPTPRGCAERTSRGAALRRDSMAAPSLEQAIEIASGQLPARGELVGRAAAELAAVDLLPTPCAARSGNNQSPSPGAAVRPSLDSITELLPTPRRSDGDGGANPLSRAERMDDVETRVIRLLADQGGGADAAPEGRPREGLRDMRNSADSEAVPERSTGGPNCVPEAQALLPGVRKQPRGGAGGFSPLASSPSEGADGLRELRGYDESSCAPPGSQSGEQRQGEPGSPLRYVSSQASLVGGTCRANAEDSGVRWGKYEPAIRRWEAVLGRPAPCPTEPNSQGKPRLAAEFPSWMMGWPAGWVTAVPGISRNDQLRIVGNGVCPQQAMAALRWLLHVQAVAA